MRFTLPLAALALLGTVTAQAAPAEDTVTVRVGFGDVDVTTVEGRAALEARIDARLKKACSLEGTERYMHNRPAVDSRCLTEARCLYGTPGV